MAQEIYDSVLKGEFNDVTLQKINDYINDVTPKNPYGRRVSQRLPQAVERSLYEGARTNVIDALFSRICESAVSANGRFSEGGRRTIEERKKEALKGWAIATGNWHTDISDFVADETPIGEGTDSKVYLSKDGKHVIKLSKGKPYGKRFRPDIDNIPLFNLIFPNSAYTILGYGEIDGNFVRILQQPFVDFATSTPLTKEERVEYMTSLGFYPLNDGAIERKKKQAIREGGLILTLESAAADTSNFLPSTDKVNNNLGENQDEDTKFSLRGVLHPKDGGDIDGTFGSPMASGLRNKGKGKVKTSSFALGEWEQAEENPDLANENGKINLVKPDGKSVDQVDYNPYIHNRVDKVNAQFKQAWERPNLVYVETEIPLTDLESGYHADKAKLPVGIHSWSNGDLILSRYDKPVRIVPWEEVADDWVERFGDRGVEFDIVPPALLPILVERGVEIFPPHKGMGKNCVDAYEEWKAEQEGDDVKYSLRTKPAPKKNRSNANRQDLTTSSSTQMNDRTKVEINPESAKKQLKDLAEKYRGINNPRGFLTDLNIALGKALDESSNYYSLELPNKGEVTIRISNHNVDAENAEDGEKEYRYRSKRSQ